MTQTPDTSAWIEDACKMFDEHGQELGYSGHVYSDYLREIAADNARLRAELAEARDKALEEAKEACEQREMLCVEMEDHCGIVAARLCAADVEALKEDTQ